MGWRRGTVALVVTALAAPAAAQTSDLRLPVLVPLTGFVALEGTSQRNGAQLAASQLREIALKPDVLDTAATPEAAVNAWARAVGDPPPIAVVGPILGTQMLALLPLARERDVPLLTISGTARLSEMGVPQFFRFFPSDATVKVAHARYVVEKLGARRPAVIYQSTAYGQSGREQEGAGGLVLVVEGDNVVVGRSEKFLAEASPLFRDLADFAALLVEELKVPAFPVSLHLRHLLVGIVEYVEPAAGFLVGGNVEVLTQLAARA